MENTSKNIDTWKRWTIFCAAGELLGIGAAGAIAYVANTAFGEPQTLLNKLFVLLMMLVAGAIEGFLLAFFQWQVLKDRFGKMRKKEWINYTMMIAVLGWFLGMLPPLFFMPATTNDPNQNAGLDFDNPFLFAALSITAGLVLGALFGLFQWFVLRKYVDQAYKWIAANALGWGLGLGWIYLFASLPNEHASMFFNIGMGILGGLMAGLSVGAVTGLFLIRLKEKQK